MKVDDDVFVNPDNLWTTLESTKLHSVRLDHANSFVNYALIGKTMVNIPPVRDLESKFYLPPSVYSPEVFPSYLQGLAYILTGSLLQPIYSCTLRTPLIPFEDAFLTGLCATQRLGLVLTHDSVSM